MLWEPGFSVPSAGLDGEVDVFRLEISPSQHLHTAAERQEQRWKLCYNNIHQ
jgi:hypothetical protein